MLCTHWHFDHSSGNRTMAKELPGLKVVATAAERAPVPGANFRIHDGELLEVGRLRVLCHVTPGHTVGSAVFEVSLSSSAEPDAAAAAFTGDTLFCGGCGRLFESSAVRLHESMARLSKRLRPDCRVFPGHESTLMLLGAMLQQEPHNQAARKKYIEARERRKHHLPTVPSLFSEELAYNPSLRSSPAELAMLCGCELHDK